MLTRRFLPNISLDSKTLHTVFATLAAGSLGLNAPGANAQEAQTGVLANNSLISETATTDSSVIKVPLLSVSAPSNMVATMPQKSPQKEENQPNQPAIRLASRSFSGKSSLPTIITGPGFSTIPLAKYSEPSSSSFITTATHDVEKLSPRLPRKLLFTPLDNTQELPVLPVPTALSVEPETRDLEPLQAELIADSPEETPKAQITPIQSETPSTPPSDAEIQARLDKLDERLNKAGTDELAPIFLILPSISSNVPNAYGASRGTVAFGAGYQSRLRYTDHKDDGTVAVLVGLSDPRKLGVDIQFSVLDLSRFGHRTSLGFKLHRQLGHDFTVAVGGENALVWPDSDSESSYYAVLTKKLRLAESSSEPFSRVYLSAGLGTGRYRSEGDIFRDKGSLNLFGSAAVNVSRSTTAFAEWTGQSLNIGASIIPFRNYPFVTTVALSDIAGGGGDGTRFTAGFGYVLAR